MNENNVKPVVVGIDGSRDSLRTLEYAAVEAVSRNLPLRIVHARSWPLYSGDAAVVFAYSAPPLSTDAENQRVIDEAVDTVHHAHPDLPVSGQVIHGGASIVLVGESEHAEIIVIGARGAGGVAEKLLGSVALDVAVRAKCPVLLVRGDTERTGPVAVGIDGKRTSWDAIGFAFAEAEQRKVPLHAIHAWHLSTADAATSTTDEPGVAQANRLLGGWLNDWQPRFPSVETHHVPVHTTDVAAALTDASETAGLLVIGSRMRGELRARLLGSTGYAMIHTSQCPLAIVHNT
ncbi:universal stress protein [Stackebrandtia nassauensis]|uniref:UspA domain protein n=1 Tax=Stackebrandtia nassauensis (strain DSM 44728 / CIP 108903 / NRRL B-16338 / NBRC 102104 / LLR-40K-21) TaxID=446470 RepID=D3PXI4_STANL|nr:universal stress protein [Stackebrandtia nassauensis]ADD43314.1 UspA domain protein [Stackebrandtia nassauensis DSM 44728]